jgi:hypothetical protein
VVTVLAESVVLVQYKLAAAEQLLWGECKDQDMDKLARYRSTIFRLQTTTTQGDHHESHVPNAQLSKPEYHGHENYGFRQHGHNARNVLGLYVQQMPLVVIRNLVKQLSKIDIVFSSSSLSNCSIHKSL